MNSLDAFNQFTSRKPETFSAVPMSPARVALLIFLFFATFAVTALWPILSQSFAFMALPCFARARASA